MLSKTKQDSLIPMPKELEGITLGMTLEELVEKRPNLKTGYFMFPSDSPNEPPRPDLDLAMRDQMLIEYLKEKPFTSIGYFIADGRLFQTSLAAEVGLNEINTIGQAIVSCIKLWGRSYKRKIFMTKTNNRTEYRPSFIWTNGVYEIEVKINLALLHSKPNKKSLTVNIANPSLIKPPPIWFSRKFPKEILGTMEADLSAKEQEEMFQKLNLDEESIQKALKNTEKSKAPEQRDEKE